MDLDISMRSSACSYTVQFYGALFREGDVWICMEVMDMSLDKFYTKVYKHGRAIPEDILGKVAFAVCRLLRYLIIMLYKHYINMIYSFIFILCLNFFATGLIKF